MTGVEILGAARADLRAEKAYYRKIDIDLGRRFVGAIQMTIESIAAHPLAMEARDFEIRRWPVEGFPHGVLYRVDQARILVLAVFHPKQDPARWESRAL